MKFEPLDIPHKYIIDCAIPGLRYKLYTILHYFEHYEDMPKRKTRVVFGRDDVTIWLNERYTVIINLLNDIDAMYPQLLHCNKAAREYMKYVL